MNFKKILIFTARICLFTYLLYLLYANSLIENINFKQFIELELCDFMEHNSYNQASIGVFKLILIFSIFGLGYLKSIVFFGDICNGFNRVVKYRTNSRIKYIGNLMKISMKFVLSDSLVWFIGLSFIGYYLKASIYEVVVGSLVFLMVNMLVLELDNITCGNSTYALVLFFICVFLQKVLFFNVGISVAILLLLIVIFSISDVGSKMRGDES